MKSTPLSMPGQPALTIVGAMLAGVALMLAPGIRAQDDQADAFSKPEAIEHRLEAARTDLRQHPADADPDLREQLEQLGAVCQFHLAAVKFVAEQQRQSTEAAQAAQSWSGFPHPPPYPLPAIDEVRETRASLDAAGQAADAQVRISSRSLEKAKNKLDRHLQAGQRLDEEADDAATPEKRAVAEHEMVLDDPAPEVRFEDFGDNALVFRLLFWLDAAKVQREPLASDLRFMTDSAFAEAGLIIAFPQRDLHFDPSSPLRVEVHPPRPAS